MTHVKNSGKYCAICCLSSFLIDNQINLTPNQIICKFPRICRAGEVTEGVLNDEDFLRLCKEIKIDVTIMPNNYELTKEDEDGSILIGMKWNEDNIPREHMVRFCKLEGDDIVIMDPDNESPLVIGPAQFTIEKVSKFFKLRIHSI